MICYTQSNAHGVAISAVFHVPPADQVTMLEEPWAKDFRRYLGQSGDPGALSVTCTQVDPKNPDAALEDKIDAWHKQGIRVARVDGARIDTPVGTIGIRGTEFVVSHDPAGQDEVDLIRGQLEIAPKALTQATTFKGPVKIMLNDNSATGSPLSQAEYDAIQARLSPAQPGAPLM